MSAPDPVRSLLPPGATPVERSLEAACARIGSVPRELGALWDPARCPVDWLPALAWTAGIEEWNAEWPEAVKRHAIAVAFELHRVRGTWGAVRRLMESIGAVWSKREGPADGLAPMTGVLVIHNSASLHGEELASLRSKIGRIQRLSFQLDIELRSGFMASLELAIGCAPLTALRTDIA